MTSAPSVLALLERRLAMLAAGVAAEWGIYVRFLDNGDEIAIGADRMMDTMSLIKVPILVTLIFVNELTFRAQQIVGQNFKFFTVFAAAGIISLMMTSAIAALQALLERRFNFELKGNPDDAARLFGFSFRRPVPAPASTPVPAVKPSKRGAVELDRAWLRSLTGSAGGSGRSEPFVVGRLLWKSYGSREVLKGVDFTVDRGEVVVIMGPSGSGIRCLYRGEVNPLGDGVWSRCAKPM